MSSNNREVWEKEYREFKLITTTLQDKPVADAARFFRWLKRSRGVNLSQLTVLDLGSGTGRQANYLAGQGARVTGLEFSRSALKIAKQRAGELGVVVDYQEQDISQPFSLPDQSVDLVLDVTVSNSLNEAGRQNYLKETERVLKAGGYFLVRALGKDGDQNAQHLLKKFPGQEVDTYIMPGLGLCERVFSRADFLATYQSFKLLELAKTTHYTKMNNRHYKRCFWVAYFQK